MPIRGKGGKGKGGRSSTRRVGTVPGVPTGVTATDVGTERPYDNGAVTVTFTPASDGSTPATSYTASGFCSVHNTTHTATGPSSPLTITGFGSGVSTTITVKANNQYGSSADSSPSSSVTVTTVPQTPSAPSASSPSAGTDSVSWSAPSNGGKAITNYYWVSSDGKSGNTAGTSVSVSQEQGTAQTYTVRADNANGSSATSSSSSSVTTTFSFAPFGFTPFGFTPFGAFGAFGAFSAFGAFGAFGAFSAFGAFGAFGAFSAFGAFGAFSAFGAFGAFGAFSAFGAFGAFSAFGAFGAFGFGPFGHHAHSLGESTRVLTPGAPGSSKPARELQVGDILLGLNIPNPANINWTEWQVDSSVLSLDSSNVVETTIVSLNTFPEDEFIYVDGDLFSKSHYILVQKDGITKFIPATEIDTSYKIFSAESKSFIDVVLVDVINMPLNKISINCEPYDNFFTETMLVFDTQDPVQ